MMTRTAPNVRRPLMLALAAGSLASMPALALAGPQGEQVVRGQAQFSRSGNQTVIRAANNTIIKYSSFDIAANETVRFIQPSKSARVLNRIDGAAPTQIDGTLLANGRVYIVNPAGVFFGPSSVVNAAAIYAGAATISDNDFLGGVDRFTNVQGGITAQGFITAEQVHLIGQRIENHGTIVAPQGVVTMSVGDEVYLREHGGRINVLIDGGDVAQQSVAAAQTGGSPVRQGVVNTGAVEAPGGSITLGAGDVLSLAMRNTGRLEAEGGEVRVAAASGEFVNDGVVSAGASRAQGGAVNVTAQRVRSTGAIEAGGEGVTLGVGDIVIGDTLSGADIDVTTIETSGGDFSVNAMQDLIVEGDIDKNDGGLTLEAGRDVRFDPAVPLEFKRYIEAEFLTIEAQREIVDSVLFGTDLTSTNGDIRLTAADGRAEFAHADTPDGATVFLTQAEDRYVGAGAGGFLRDPESTNLVVNITDGFLIMGGQFGGVSGQQAILSVDGTAATFVEIQDDLTIGDTASFRAADDVRVDGFVRAQHSVLLHAGADNTGAVRFLSPGLDIAGGSITLQAGQPGVQGGSAFVDAKTNNPLFTGPGGIGSNPGSFAIRQDLAITDAALPAASQFGAGTTMGLTYRLESFENDVTLTNGALVDGSRLTLAGASATSAAAGGQVFVADELDLISLTTLGRATLDADVTTTGFQLFDGPTDIDGLVELTAGTTATFNRTLDGVAPGEGNLVIVVGDGAAFNGEVGGLRALEKLTIDSTTGTLTVAGGLLRTTGTQTYNIDVDLLDDTLATAIGTGSIVFDQAVDGSVDLDVLTTEQGFIVFNGPVGQQQRLETMTLSTAGADGVRDVPALATIVNTEGDLIVSAREFIMGQHEKLTAANGSFELDALELAVLGDVATMDDMLISAPQIELLRRQAATLLDEDGSILSDGGLDYVAGGMMLFDGPITLAGESEAPMPRFGTASGNASFTGAEDFDVVMLGPDELGATRLQTPVAGVPFAAVLDLRVVSNDAPPPPPPPPGPGPDPQPQPEPDSEVELVDPRNVPPQFEDFVIPEVYDVELFRSLALSARPVEGGEAEQSVTGRYLYSELPNELSGFGPAGGTPLAVTRFDIQAVQAVVDRANALFTTPEGAPRADEVTRVVSGSIGRYMSLDEAGALEPAGFAQYLAQSGPDAPAATTFAQLQAMITQLRSLDLPRNEYVRARNALLTPLVPDGAAYTVDDLARLVESDALLTAQLEAAQAETGDRETAGL